jgi:hypothetical protein
MCGMWIVHALEVRVCSRVFVVAAAREEGDRSRMVHDYCCCTIRRRRAAVVVVFGEPIGNTKSPQNVGGRRHTYRDATTDLAHAVLWSIFCSTRLAPMVTANNKVHTETLSTTTTTTTTTAAATTLISNEEKKIDATPLMQSMTKNAIIQPPPPSWTISNAVNSYTGRGKEDNM